MASSVYLAVDMGASSGRHVAGALDGSRIRLAEVYRFDNGAVPVAGHLYWDILALWSHLRKGLCAARTAHGEQIVSVGIDTWGVDFALLSRDDELLGNPYQYRDKRTEGMLERAFEVVPREEIFAQTGVQFMQINTLYQLLSMRIGKSPLLDSAQSLLLMPDLFNWLLAGIKGNEFTDATTTQCFNPETRKWAFPLLERLEIPTHIFGEFVEPGTRLGRLRSEVAEETGLKNLQVIAPGTHDTASAVMAVPTAEPVREKPSWCYISSGTWSLMGVEVPKPIINAKCLQLNFTNEGGVGGTIRLLKNIAGLWLVQECRRIWNAGGQNFDWEALAGMAAKARPLASLIDPDDPAFLAPANMPRAIAEYCQRNGQAVPADEGSTIRCAIDSLALRYRQVLTWLEELTGGRIDTIHIVGGGTQNRLLCQAAADACNRVVWAGPVEATALGNVLTQAIAAGQLAGIADAREMVRSSFEIERYEPRDTSIWDEAYARFTRLVS